MLKGVHTTRFLHGPEEHLGMTKRQAMYRASQHDQATSRSMHATATELDDMPAVDFVVFESEVALFQQCASHDEALFLYGNAMALEDCILHGLDCVVARHDDAEPEAILCLYMDLEAAELTFAFLATLRC